MHFICDRHTNLNLIAASLFNGNVAKIPFLSKAKNLLQISILTNLKTVPGFKLSYFLFLIYDLIITLLYFIVFYCCIHVRHKYYYCHLYSCSFVTSPTLSVSRQMTFILRVSIRSRSLPFWQGSFHCQLSAGSGWKQLALRVSSSRPQHVHCSVP